MSSDSQCISGLIVIVTPTATPAVAPTGHPFCWVPHPSQLLLHDLETGQAFPPDFCAVLTSKIHFYILMVLSLNSIINPGADGPCGNRVYDAGDVLSGGFYQHTPGRLHLQS